MSRSLTGGPAAAQTTSPSWHKWFAAVLIVLLIAALWGVWILAQVPAFVPEFTGGPRAQLSQTVFDYGDVKNNTTVETVFTVKNVGDQQLYFPMEPVVTVVEGCCPPKSKIDKSALEPGESAEVRLSFSMHEGMDGPHDFRVKVVTSDVEEPEQEVRVLSNWIP